MAIGITIPDEQKPTMVRIWKTVIDNGIDKPTPVAEMSQEIRTNVEVPTLDENGNPVLDENGNPVTHTEVQVTPAVVTGYHAEFQSPPKVELVIRGVWPLLHPTTGAQMTNPIGQPAYINSEYIARITLPLAELTSYLSLWENMTAISYEKVQAKLTAGTIEWEKTR
jgi:hypothetical protein